MYSCFGASTICGVSKTRFLGLCFDHTFKFSCSHPALKVQCIEASNILKIWGRAGVFCLVFIRLPLFSKLDCEHVVIYSSASSVLHPLCLFITRSFTYAFALVYFVPPPAYSVQFYKPPCLCVCYQQLCLQYFKFCSHFSTLCLHCGLWISIYVTSIGEECSIFALSAEVIKFIGLHSLAFPCICIL